MTFVPRHTAEFARRVATMLAALVLVTVVVSSAFSAFAQDGIGPVPDNAHERSFGRGWDCDLGYRVKDEACTAIDVPENAYATGRTYGRGWACRHGYEEVKGSSACAKIQVPANAFLRSSGYEWRCKRGFRRVRDSCIPIVVPANAFLDTDIYGPGWSCERGYEPHEETCVPITVPENAHLDDAGNRWRCDQSFQLVDGRCVLIR